MEKTTRDFLLSSFNDLVDAEFKRFCGKLCDSKLEPRIPRGSVERKDREDMASLLIETYTESRAVEVTVQILRSINFNQTAEKLKSDYESRHPSPQHEQVDSKSGNNQMHVQDKCKEPLKLIPCSQEFKDKILKEKGNEVYKPLDKSVRKRLALLINNIEFDKGLNRSGAEKDEENMEWLLKSLDYKVEKYRNLSGMEMDDAVKNFAGYVEHADSDSTFVVIMSHGTRIDNRDAILGVHFDDRNPIDIFFVDEIYSHLNTKNCAALHDKPKVILIQACRGGEDGGLEINEGEHNELKKIKQDGWVHKEKDFTCLMSCTPETVSFRDSDLGTPYVRHLVSVFCESAHEIHIDELFRKVMQRFESDPEMKGGFEQMACKERETLVKQFYLFPGL
ncbi:caspase a-like [Myxocyprinus asiaticus]|uniref:caspase a-like n=1 Tax=Myxocyprinus asiaticus TaxID=70543 RepID=UPI002223E161|nr:caspase a-like [Myxocyprinus asiaticus]